MTDANNGTLLDFPCEFPIKVFGLAADGFSDNVLLIVRRHLGDTGELSVESRPSQAGKYVAVTITINATCKPQLDAIYQDLTDSPDVIMAL